MGRKLRVDFSNETPTTNEDNRNQDGPVRYLNNPHSPTHTTNHHRRLAAATTPT